MSAYISKMEMRKPKLKGKNFIQMTALKDGKGLTLTIEGKAKLPLHEILIMYELLRQAAKSCRDERINDLIADFDGNKKELKTLKDGLTKDIEETAKHLMPTAHKEKGI
jgi:hypothetical protein